MYRVYYYYYLSLTTSTYLLTYLLTYSLTYLLTTTRSTSPYLLTCLLTYLLANLLTYSPQQQGLPRLLLRLTAAARLPAGRGGPGRGLVVPRAVLLPYCCRLVASAAVHVYARVPALRIQELHPARSARACVCSFSVLTHHPVCLKELLLIADLSACYPL